MEAMEEEPTRQRRRTTSQLNTSFAKRRTGLMRKASEIGALTGCRCLLVVQHAASRDGATQLYATPDWRHCICASAQLAELLVVTDLGISPESYRVAADLALPVQRRRDDAASLEITVPSPTAAEEGFDATRFLDTARKRQNCFVKRREALMRKADELSDVRGRVLLVLQFRDRLHVYATPDWRATLRIDSDWIALFHHHSPEGESREYATPRAAVPGTAELKYIDDTTRLDVDMLLACNIGAAAAEQSDDVPPLPPPAPVPLPLPPAAWTRPELVFPSLAPPSPEAPTLQDIRNAEENAREKHRIESWYALQASLERMSAVPPSVRLATNWQLL